MNKPISFKTKLSTKEIARLNALPVKKSNTYYDANMILISLDKKHTPPTIKFIIAYALCLLLAYYIVYLMLASL